MAKLRVGKPVWLEGTKGRPRRSYPSLTGDWDGDVVIVGAGMTGSATAALFAGHGIRVAVVDAALAARGSTAASTALLLREPDKSLGELGRKYGGAAARRIWRLSHAAARDLVRTLRRLDIDCDLDSRDSVYFTVGADAVAPLRAELALRHRAGFRGQWLTPGALRRLTGMPARGGILTRGNAQFDPFKASLGLLRAAAARGADVFERTAVSRIETTRSGVRVVTPGGRLTARRVIVATGYAVPQFEPLVGRFEMRHTYVLATAPLSGAQQRELGFGTVMAWDTERPYHYLRWTPDRRLLIGGCDRPVVAGRRRAAALKAATGELRGYFERLLPALADLRVELAWEGLFAVTPDSLPFIGPHRRYPHHLFALGYGGNGMTFGFLAARLLLEQWQGRVSEDHDLFAFGRDL
ncbi:MAG: FAD-binding oxidoreductase [Acidobacteriota bacterium]